ncbi:WXG100 family type VII secretion target [Mycobacterium sp.]|uniref:WXG100 family type VII secretion target n=1 Tax=Mycobacterium sp. TaxID=1785 RepID=UPI002C255090|nr:WXG100 family type VII secretion target [Mycobacterium sp.]HKP44401.1 WXG100 family type VII secretion target [Mycobacterium sp.]
MSQLGVTPSELVAVAAELESVAEGLRSGLGSLDGEVSGLLGSGWSGEAASAYSGVWQEWHDGASQVVQGLTAMHGLLQEAAGRYSGTDTSGAADVSGSGL